MQIFSFYLNNYSPNFLTTSSRTRRCPWKFKKKFWKTQVLELFSQCYPPGKLWVPSTNFRPLGPAVWPAIREHIYEWLILLYRSYLSIYQMYSNVYSCVCKQYSERLYQDLINHMRTRVAEWSKLMYQVTQQYRVFW